MANYVVSGSSDGSAGIYIDSNSTYNGKEYYVCSTATVFGQTPVYLYWVNYWSNNWCISPYLGDPYADYNSGIDSGDDPSVPTWSGITVTKSTGFDLSVSTSSQSVMAGTSGSAITTTVTSRGGFNSTVDLTLLTTSPDITGVFTPTPVTPPSNSTVTSNLVISVGSNVSAGSYTVTAQGSGGGVTSFSNPTDLSLLIHFDGTNGSTLFTDASPNAATIINNGTPTVSTAKKVFGTGSLYINTNGDLQVISTTPFTTGTNDFTLEFWLYLNAINNGQQNCFALVSDGIGVYSNYIGFYMPGDGNTHIGLSSGSSLVASWVPVIGVWTHLAITRASNVWTIWANGTSIATQSNSVSFPDLKYVEIGGYNNSPATTGVNAYIDEFRILSGVAAPSIWSPPTTNTIPIALTVRIADTTPPVVSSAAINSTGTTLTIVWTETGNPPVLPATGGTGLYLSGMIYGTATLSSINTSGTTTTVTISRPIYIGETITLHGVNTNFTDSAYPPNNVVDFTYSITNNSTQPAYAANVDLLCAVIYDNTATSGDVNTAITYLTNKYRINNAGLYNSTEPLSPSYAIRGQIHGGGADTISSGGGNTIIDNLNFDGGIY